MHFCASISVDRPDAGGAELEEVAVGVAKVDALAAVLPGGALLDGNSVFGEPGFPGGQGAGGNGEGKVKLAGARVWGRAGEGTLLLEKEQDLAGTDSERAAALGEISDHVEAEDLFVEGG